MSRISVFFIFILSFCSSCGAEVLSAAAVNSVKKMVPGGVIERIEQTKYSGLVELVTPSRIYYTDAKGSFLLHGNIFDVEAQTDVTRQRWERLAEFEFSTLPFSDAIKTVRGDGSRLIATFEDPNCGYCKRLFRELSKLENVTIYTFLTPILSEDSYLKSAAIWCAGEDIRSKMWSVVMSSNLKVQPAIKQERCDLPLDRNISLSKKLRIKGTPAILFFSNERLSGYQTSSKLEKLLSMAK